MADKNDKLVLAKADLVMRYQESLQALRKANDDVIEARVRLVEAISDVAALEERNADIVQRLEDEKKRVVRLTDEVQRARAEAIVAKDKAQDMLAPYRDPDTQDYIPEMLQRMEAAKDKTVESIDEDIQIEMAKFDVIQEADPGVLRDFEKRARDIEKLEAESATRQADMQDLDENIRALRAKWEPGLDELIRRINDAFSYNFEQISCAGEVGVHKDEDFDKWAVEIKVKFRQVVLFLAGLLLCVADVLTPVRFPPSQRERDAPKTGPTSTVGWRARRVDDFLSHVPAVYGTVALSRGR